MSKAKILAELPRLKSEELAEIQARIEELAVHGPDGWLVDGELTDDEKRLIETRLDDLDQHPGKSIPWAQAEAQLKDRFGE